MEFIDFKLLYGDSIAVRRDYITLVREISSITQDMVKQHPFLKGVPRCTVVGLSIPPGELFCVDSYSTIIEKLK